MFDTALTAKDMVFLAQGAGVTLLVTAIAVVLGTILGIIFGIFRFQVGPWWAAPLTFVLDVSRSGFHAWLNRPTSPARSRTPSSSRRSRRASRPATGPMAPAASGAMFLRTGLPAGFTGSNG